MRLYVGTSPFAGRTREVELLDRAADEAAGGRLHAVLVHGEPGVGKTRLVSEVCARRRDAGWSVLWGQCVHFGTTSVPYLPFVSAFEDWSATRPAVPDEVKELVTALSGETGSGSARAVRLLNTALNVVTADSPAVLVVDDVQWADTSSLDLLAYTLAVAQPRRLAVLVTYRDTELAEGHPLHGWLGDVGRLPGVTDLRLGRLSKEETEAQASALLGGPVRVSLVDALLARTQGNAYLNELLLRDLPPDADELPGDLPDSLRTALLAAWHRLSGDARELARLVAVAQRPVAQPLLAAVARRRVMAGSFDDAVLEAVDAGLLARRGDDLWFHHPLIAEVLTDTLPTTERRRLHALYVEEIELTGSHDPALAAQLAMHAEHAGMIDDAFRYALLAADHASSVHALPELADQLLRAAHLWASVSPETRAGAPSQAGLWCDAAMAASRVGRVDEAADAASVAVRVADRESEPGVAARALRIESGCHFDAGRLTDQPVERDREAVRLAALSDDVLEQVRCLRELSDSELWSGNRAEAQRHADEAMSIASASGSSTALAWALFARAQAFSPSPRALADADEGQRLALLSDDLDAAGVSYICKANVLEDLHCFVDKAQELARGYTRARERGEVARQQALAALAGWGFMDIAEYGRARTMLNEALAFPSAGLGGIFARQAAAFLEVCMGDVEAVRRHTERALEIAPDLPMRSGLNGATTVAAYHLVTGHPERSVEVIHRSFPAHAGAPTYPEWMLLWAAIAASQLARDERGRPSPVLEKARRQLRETLEAHAAARGEAFAPVDEIARAHRLVLDAELARAFGTEDELERWRKLAEVEEWHGEAWIMTQGFVHWAQALADARADRSEIAVPLRRAHARSRQLGYRLLLDETEELARRTRIPLTEGSAHGSRARSPGEQMGLTARELEVLEHLAAGRTYAEIARALFISQKTVSVHVTHILQKSGASNRSEAAAWAWESGLLRPGPGAVGSR